MNLRSPIGYIVSFIYRERNSRHPDKFLLRRLEKELNTLIDAPTIEFTPLPELPHPCPVPPEDMYPDMTDEEFIQYEEQRNKEKEESIEWLNSLEIPQRVSAVEGSEVP